VKTDRAAPPRWSERRGAAFAAAACAALFTLAASPAPAGDPAAAKAAPSEVQFIDVAPAAGLSLRNVCGSAAKITINETVGNGVCLFDADEDDRLDIFLPNSQPDATDRSAAPARSGLFRNRGDGTFEDITARAGVGLPGYWAQGCVAGDYDDDGHVDLVVTGFGRAWLMRNLGGTRFQDVTAAAGLGGERGWGTGAAFGDYDHDGRLDLYISHYVDYDANSPPLPKAGSGINCMFRGHPVMCGPRGLKPQIGRLYHNEGGRFRDVTATSGMATTPLTYGLGAIWSDLDLDGDLDLYVATDSTPNLLYRNDGRGRFTEIGTVSGAAFSEDGRGQASMGVDAGDYDDDGRFDLVTTNFSHDYTTLYHNEDRLLFLDVSLESGLGPPTMPMLKWGVAFLDYDNDGRRDIFEANGHVYPGIDALNVGTTWRQPNQLFHNEGAGRFRDAGSESGPAFRDTHSARGAAVGDLDNDGDPDIVVNNMDETPSLLRNDGGNRRHWVGLTLRGAPRNRFAVGARVILQAGPKHSSAETHAGSSHNSCGDPRLLFGLGDFTAPVSAEIHWPDGRVEVRGNLAVDRYHTIVEGTPAGK
jgi:hypothetical protein